ncbi:type II toxin-antitoxin system RelE/ParE family toxin [Porticoccus sp. GXU_MW_L64]
MRIFKTKAFSKWSEDEGLSDEALIDAVQEMEQGLIDAKLGGNVCKKRVALGNKGKSGGVRTLLAFKVSDKAFFLYGFAKSQRANVNTRELKALKLLAAELLGHDDKQLAQALRAGELIEIEVIDDD